MATNMFTGLWVIAAMVTMVRSPSEEIKFRRELQVGLAMPRDLIDRGTGLDGGAGLDPTIFFYRRDLFYPDLRT